MRHVSGGMRNPLLSLSYTRSVYARIAQLVEHITDTDGVLGSNPSARTKDRTIRIYCGFSAFVRDGAMFFVSKNRESGSGGLSLTRRRNS